MLAYRDSLERRYDGPIPPADPAAPTLATAQRARLFQRLAGDVRAQAATRRGRLSASAAPRDERLQTLTHDLSLYRTHGTAWMSP